MLKTIDMNAGKGYGAFLFPDNQPHIRLIDIQREDRVDVRCSITSSLKLVQLGEVANAIRHAGGVLEDLYITYLFAARSDRVIVAGDSVDLEVIADFINTIGFKKVVILDAHSSVSTQLIRKSINYIPTLYTEINWKDCLFVCPDKGAIDRVPLVKMAEKDVIYCEKSRDAEGRVSLKVLNPDAANGRDIIICDDICDGGATFIAIAKQLINPKSITLVVTHGIFSKGLDELEKYFDLIITSDSLHQDPEIALSKKLRIVKI